METQNFVHIVAAYEGHVQFKYLVLNISTQIKTLAALCITYTDNVKESVDKSIFMTNKTQVPKLYKNYTVIHPTQSIQTGSGTHPTTYSMRNGGSFPR